MSHRTAPASRRRTAVVAATAAVLLAAAAALWLSGGLAHDSGPKAQATNGAPTQHARVVPPTPNAVFDYQIGAPYPPAAGVTALSRDRSARPVPGLYNVCYVNAFQAQPDALPWWREHHPDLVLRDAAGRVVIDEAWDEALLDTSTADKRARLARIVGGWIDGCARSGFQAVEPDNLDSYERSRGRLTEADNVAFARLLAGRAHAAGLAVGQKNTVDVLPARGRIGFDFAVVEECGRYDECGTFAKAYASRVFVIEYEAEGFAAACAEWGSRLSVVRREADVTARGAGPYVFRAC